MFVLGLTMFLAAASKLRDGLDWIANGTVKYHFISDLEHAWVPWGVWLTSSHPVAVALSAAAVIAEVLVLTAAFSTSARYRMATGACAAVLLAGFALFQGIVWPGWWILLLGFFPWHWIGGSRLATATGTLSVAQRVALCLLTVLQVCVGWARIEARPVVSAYDMYSTTYADDEEYELASDLTYRILAVTSGGAAEDLECDLDDDGARVLTDAACWQQRRCRCLLLWRCSSSPAWVSMAVRRGRSRRPLPSLFLYPDPHWDRRRRYAQWRWEAMSQADFDSAKAEAFAGRVVTALNNGALCLMMSIGHRTGSTSRTPPRARPSPPRSATSSARSIFGSFRWRRS